MERKTGFEPATTTLARWGSTGLSYFRRIVTLAGSGRVRTAGIYLRAQPVSRPPLARLTGPPDPRTSESMSVLVQKFGGTSVGTPERIDAVAERILAARQAGHHLVAV